MLSEGLKRIWIIGGFLLWFLFTFYIVLVVSGVTFYLYYPSFALSFVLASLCLVSSNDTNSLLSP